MRAFIAIELPADVRAALSRLQQQLAGSGADVKWVEAAHLHLTLRFLGEITDEQRAAVERWLGEAAGRERPMAAGLSDLGAFPSPSAPRVLWVGMNKGAAELAEAAARVDEGLLRLGFPAEARGFVAHITLGRVRSSRGRAALVRQLAAVRWQPPPAWTITHVTLYQSLLSAAGARYTVLARMSFRPQ